MKHEILKMLVYIEFTVKIDLTIQFSPGSQLNGKNIVPHEYDMVLDRMYHHPNY